MKRDPLREPIKVLVPDMPTADEIAPYLAEIDESRWYTNFGQCEQRLRAALSKQLDGAEIVTFSNATAALECALVSLGLRRGSRVLCPAFTFPATATAIVRAGLIPVWADVDPGTWCLTPQIAVEAWNRHPFDAVVPVCAFGAALDLVAWAAFEVRAGAPAIIDAAAAFGNQSAPHGMPPTCFSMHATKSLGAGEGGFILTFNSDWAEVLRAISNFGFALDRTASDRGGTNAKLSEYHAAVGLASLARWPQIAERRIALARMYRAGLWQCVPQDPVLQVRPDLDIRTTFETLLPAGTDVDAIAAALTADGIETRRWYYPPLYKHPAFAHFGPEPDLPATREISSRLLGLPFHTGLTEEDIERVCVTLARALEQSESTDYLIGAP